MYVFVCGSGENNEMFIPTVADYYVVNIKNWMNATETKW